MDAILEMPILGYFILGFSIAAYIPLVFGVIKQKDESQTFFTWILYFGLDFITYISNKAVVKGAWIILFGFAIGSFIMSLILALQKRWGWKLPETFTFVLVAFCVFIWKTAGPYWSFRFGFVSESIVGLYLAYKTFKKPKVEYNLLGYIFFFVVCIIVIVALMITNKRADWSFELLGYPICEACISALTCYPLFKKLKEERINYFLIQ